jgi:hypothetical protein
MVSSMLTLEDYYMGRDWAYGDELTDQMELDAAETVKRVNLLLEAFGQERVVNSGWRPAEINAKTPHASKHSLHIICQACDLRDPDGSLDAWCYDNQDKLAEIGLWLESPSNTDGWCHVQIKAPPSGNRVFLP